MAEAKPLASLTPTLLARKGGARPAIRSQQADITQAQDDAEPVRESAAARARSTAGSKVVTLSTVRAAAPAAKGNAVRRQRDRLAERIAGEAAKRPAKLASKAARASERPSAFTLRLDSDRHLKLRLASALTNRSAQQLVVEALDSMLATLPGVADLAARAGKRR